MRRFRVLAVVPAAGYGKRLGAKIKKPFVLLRGRPLASYALEALEKSGAIDGIIIASEKSCVKNLKRLVKRFKIKKTIDIIVGGRTRGESVRNCLEAAGPSFDIVLIHDAARPFVTARMIKDAISGAARFGAAITAVPESDTVKLVGKNSFVKRTLDRDEIFRAQTPQAFKYELVKKAYSSRGRGAIATDDAMLVEAIGSRVKIVPGAYSNIKITTKEDLKLAEVLL